MEAMLDCRQRAVNEHRAAALDFFNSAATARRTIGKKSSSRFSNSD